MQRYEESGNPEDKPAETIIEKVKNGELGLQNRKRFLRVFLNNN